LTGFGCTRAGYRKRRPWERGRGEVSHRSRCRPDDRGLPLSRDRRRVGALRGAQRTDGGLAGCGCHAPQSGEFVAFEVNHIRRDLHPTLHNRNVHEADAGLQQPAVKRRITTSARRIRGRVWSETPDNGRVSAAAVAPKREPASVLTPARSLSAAEITQALIATPRRRRIDALGRSIHVRGKGCAHDHDRFAHRDPSSSFSLVRTQARERGSACPARPIRTAPSVSI
jgi:hypothetical protein